MNAANYQVGDALEDAVEEFRTILLGGGQVAIAVHRLSRDRFDLLPGEAQHFPEAPEHKEFWSKAGFDWHGDRHAVYVKYFTNEKPVVVPLRAEEAV